MEMGLTSRDSELLSKQMPSVFSQTAPCFCIFSCIISMGNGSISPVKTLMVISMWLSLRDRTSLAIRWVYSKDPWWPSPSSRTSSELGCKEYLGKDQAGGSVTRQDHFAFTHTWLKPTQSNPPLLLKSQIEEFLQALLAGGGVLLGEHHTLGMGVGGTQ